MKIAFQELAGVIDVVEGLSSTVLYELINLCNLLIPSEEGAYGFGHGRYQEHLATKEIISDSSINIVQLFKNPW